MDNPSDHDAYICKYFNISEIKLLDETHKETRENLKDILGPLDSPIVNIKDLFNQEAKATFRDIVVKILGVSHITNYKNDKHKGIYQRILAKDQTGIIELTVFQPNLAEIDDIVRITKLQTYYDDNAKTKEIKVTSKTKFYKIPFHLPIENLRLEELIPDTITLANFQKDNYYNLRALVKEIGTLEKTSEKKGKISRIRIILMSKNFQLDVICKKQIADSIKNVNIFDVIYIRNVRLGTTLGKIVAFTTDYSVFKNSTIPKEKQIMPQTLKIHDLPIKPSDIISLLYDPNSTSIIGRIRCKMLAPIKREGDYGVYYQTGIIDASGSSLLTIKEESIHKFNIFKPGEIKQIDLTGVCKSNKNHLLLIDTQINIIEDNKPLALAFITAPSEIEEMENIFSLNAKYIEKLDQKIYFKKDGSQGTYIRARFELFKRIITITAFNEEDKGKINSLQINKHYHIYFLNKTINNGYVNIGFTPFTLFELDLEKNE